ncbi:hypothetical protein OAL48_00845 [Candidatus Pelagibacter sp.]|nr:hypothetical protein [Candidatus Pelagibacter sp.]
MFKFLVVIKATKKTNNFYAQNKTKLIKNNESAQNFEYKVL